MNIQLRTLSHGPLNWKDQLPPAFKGIRLPGGTISSSVGDFGSVCIQELKADNYFIRYNVFDIFQQFVTTIESKESGIHSSILLKGHANHEMTKIGKWTLRQNQFSLLHADSPEIIWSSSHVLLPTVFYLV